MKLFEIAGPDEAKIIENIKADCQPFLNQWEGKPIYRGMKKSGDFLRLSVRQDRKPSDTPEEMSDAIDTYFNKKFGFKARGGAMFATGSMSIAKSYGTAYMVFPIGDFKFVWSTEISDMFAELESYVEDADEDDLETNSEGMSPIIQSFLSMADYQDHNLADAIDSRNEIMIGCKEYYAVKSTDSLSLATLVAKLK